jgi:transcription elongation factor Elf1
MEKFKIFRCRVCGRVKKMAEWLFPDNPEVIEILKKYQDRIELTDITCPSCNQSVQWTV